MIGSITCLRLHLSYGKAIFSCFCMLDYMLNFLDQQKALKITKASSSLPSLINFNSHSHSIHPNLNNSNNIITITIAQPTRMIIATSVSSHSFVIDFSITIEKEEQEQPQNRNPNATLFRYHSCNFNWLV